MSCTHELRNETCLFLGRAFITCQNLNSFIEDIQSPLAFAAYPTKGRTQLCPWEKVQRQVLHVVIRQVLYVGIQQILFRLKVRMGSVT